MIKQFTIQDMENLRLGKEIYTGDEKERMRLIELFGEEAFQFVDEQPKKPKRVSDTLLKLMVEQFNMSPSKILDEIKKRPPLLNAEDLKDQLLQDGYLRSKKDIFKVIGTEIRNGNEYVLIEVMSSVKKGIFAREKVKVLKIRKENLVYYSKHLLDLIFAGDLVIYAEGTEIKNGILLEKIKEKALVINEDGAHGVCEEAILKVYFKEFLE